MSLTTDSAAINTNPLTWLYVTGAPRSGTTVLQQILNSHPEVLCFHEYGLSNIFSLVEGLFACDRLRPPGREKLQVRAARMPPTMPISGDTLQQFEEIRTAATVRAVGDDVPIPKEALHRGPITRAIFEIVSGKPGLKVAGDKLPYRIDGAGYDNPADRFPNSKTIVIVRRPDMVIASSLRRAKATAEGKDEWHIQDVDAAINEWKLALSVGMQWKAKAPDNVLLLKYEDVCDRFDEASDLLAGFLGVENKFANLAAPTPYSLLEPVSAGASSAIVEALGEVIRDWNKLSLENICAKAA